MSTPTAQLDAGLAELFERNKVPDFVAEFLLAQEPPIVSVKEFANAATTNAEVVDDILGPAGIDTIEPQHKLPAKAATRAAWREAKEIFDRSLATTSKTATTTTMVSPDEEIDPDVRRRLVEEFSRRFGWKIPMEDQPSDVLLALTVSHHRRRAADFIALSKATPVNDGGDQTLTGPTQVAGTGLFLMTTAPKKAGDFSVSGATFVHAIRLLMYGYTLASRQDEKDAEWLPLEVAMLYIAFIDKLVRLDSKGNNTYRARIMETEQTVRKEWFRAAQENPGLTLGEIIVAAQNKTANLWPMQSELTAAALVTRNQVVAGKRPLQRSNVPSGNPTTSLQEMEMKRIAFNVRDNRRQGTFRAPELRRAHHRGTCSMGTSCRNAHSEQELGRSDQFGRSTSSQQIAEYWGNAPHKGDAKGKSGKK